MSIFNKIETTPRGLSSLFGKKPTKVQRIKHALTSGKEAVTNFEYKKKITSAAQTASKLRIKNVNPFYIK